MVDEKDKEIEKVNKQYWEKVNQNKELRKENNKLQKQQFFQKDFDGVETYFGESDWAGYTEQWPWIRLGKIKKLNLPICDCQKPCGWYLGHYWTHDEYLKKKVK